MKTVLSALVLLLLPSGLLGQSSVSQRASLFKTGAIRVLILTGQNNHDWRATTPLLKTMLLETGRFDVRVNEEPAGMTSETLSPYDVVVLNYNGPRWGKQSERALEEFVHTGKGLVGVHGANWAFSGLIVLGDNSVPIDILEAPWKQYKLMIGGVWSDAPPASGHAPRHKFEIKIVDADNPITKGLSPAFETDDELYHNIHMAPNVHVLATAYDDPNNKPQSEPGKSPAKPPETGKQISVRAPQLDMNPTGKDEPMMWTLHYGQGRTFYTVLGHDTQAMSTPGFCTTFVRGVEWAATGSVKKPEPQFQSCIRRAND